MRRAHRCGAKVGLNLGSNGIVRAQPLCFKELSFRSIFSRRERLWKLIEEGEIDAAQPRKLGGS